jgi:acyl-coenzyme A synthetase/AMP-(fatty) acid ligase/acyl carrier protein
VLNQTPAAFYQFTRAALKKRAKAFDALRLVVFGGDSLASNRLAPWVEAFPTSRVKLVNMYGITETTVHVTYREVSEADIAGTLQLNLVGRPLPETGVWIVDCNGRLQPPGIAGEIVVSGSGVGMGYLNRDELTARKFAVLEQAGGERCYWSGDVGYVSAEHGLVYLGRNDHQVQVRGFRVECEEIARYHEEHQSVAEALVVPIKNVHGTELVAYLVGDETAAPASWRPWLATRLPDYMIPSYTVWLDVLPLTANGKVDRKALPDPFSVVPSPESDVPGEIEATVISAWQQVLAHEHIGPQTNFFDVGGHSLKALALVDVLQTQFGFNIGVADVFELPTPRQQAALCASVEAQSPTSGDNFEDLLDDVGLDALEALIADVSDKRQDS